MIALKWFAACVGLAWISRPFGNQPGNHIVTSCDVIALCGELCRHQDSQSQVGQQ
jgi:hypothetical protein